MRSLLDSRAAICIGAREVTRFLQLLATVDLTVSMKAFVLICVLLIAGCSSAGGLTPFTTDGCSLFPEGTLKQKDLWLTCCTDHDLAYWMGGTSDDREKADRELKECVAKAGERSIAQLMLAGVRVGGTPYLPSTFRWGYGWPWPRGYTALTDEEWLRIKETLSGKHREGH